VVGVTNTTNLQLNKPDVDDFYNIGVQNENMDIIDQKIAENEKTLNTAKTSIDNHVAKKDNPHGVTKAQIGLSSVPNVSTNDQTPTYTVAGNNTELASGEKLSIAFGKISKAISSLISHLADTVSHITSAERTKWNNKLDATATATNADKLDGLDSTAFVKASEIKSSGLLDTNLASLAISDTFTFQNLCNNTKVTFFTNWSDVTNFPKNYGSGVMFPCLDARHRAIYYSGGTNDGKSSYLGKALQTDGVWSVNWVESASVSDLTKYLTLAGGIMTGNIDMNGKKMVGCGGHFAPSLKDIYSHAGIELREKDFIGNANLNIGYAPTLGFHWSGTIGAGIAMDASGNFHFIKGDGSYSTLKTGTANVIISDTAPADTTALWVS